MISDKVTMASDGELLEKAPSINARSYALIALVVYLVAECASWLVFRYTEGRSHLEFVLLISIKTLIFWWILPLLIVYKIEKRDLYSLGFFIPRKRRWSYAVFAVAVFVLPLAIVGYDSYYPVEFVEQILYIGFSEEVFYRGYIMTRQCKWLGKYPGLLVTSLLFGLGHIISRIADHGIGYFLPATYTGLQTFFGGLIFGLIYIRAKNIWPSVILHVSTNMYLQDIISHFTH